MSTASLHHHSCEWHHDQYDWECTCGATTRGLEPMSGEARELRELARDIYALAGQSRVHSIAAPAVQALCDYLSLRARVMELEAERDYKAWQPARTSRRVP